MPFGRESVEDAYGLENLVVRLSWSPMPFGRESVEDGFYQACLSYRAEMSPMPFGRESVEDVREWGKARRLNRLSPMPFGRESVEDERHSRRGTTILTGHQCLSAVSPLRTRAAFFERLESESVTNAFRP